MIRSLSKELQEIAEKELNENPSRIQEDLDHIKDWLKKQKHLTIREGDQWLLTFLRGCKYSLERTKEKIDYFHSIRTLTPELYTDRDTMSSGIQEMLSKGAAMLLPTGSNPSSPRVALFRMGVCDSSKVSFAVLCKVYYMMLDVLMNEDDTSITAGVLFLIDYKDFPLEYIKNVTPSFIQKCMHAIQHAYPLRFKGFYPININPTVEMFLSVCRGFLSEKLQKRFRTFSQGNFNKIYDLIPKEIIPKEYGGDGDSTVNLTAAFKEKMESYRDWFIEDDKYHSNEELRVGEPKTSANMFGVEGSFRKLIVD